MKMITIRTIVIPHTVKVLGFLIISGALTAVINNIGQFHFAPTTEMIVMAAINALLAALKKYIDADPQ